MTRSEGLSPETAETQLEYTLVTQWETRIKQQWADLVAISEGIPLQIPNFKPLEVLKDDRVGVLIHAAEEARKHYQEEAATEKAFDLQHGSNWLKKSTLSYTQNTFILESTLTTDYDDIYHITLWGVVGSRYILDPDEPDRLRDPQKTFVPTLAILSHTYSKPNPNDSLVFEVNTLGEMPFFDCQLGNGGHVRRFLTQTGEIYYPDSQ